MGLFTDALTGVGGGVGVGVVPNGKVSAENACLVADPQMRYSGGVFSRVVNCCASMGSPAAGRGRREGVEGVRGSG